MGKNMRNALAFVKRNNGWHSFANEPATINAIKRLQARGLVEVNKFRQFRIKS